MMVNILYRPAAVAAFLCFSGASPMDSFPARGGGQISLNTSPHVAAPRSPKREIRRELRAAKLSLRNQDGKKKALEERLELVTNAQQALSKEELIKALSAPCAYFCDPSPEIRKSVLDLAAALTDHLRAHAMPQEGESWSLAHSCVLGKLFDIADKLLTDECEVEEVELEVNGSRRMYRRNKVILGERARDLCLDLFPLLWRDKCQEAIRNLGEKAANAWNFLDFKTMEFLLPLLRGYLKIDDVASFLIEPFAMEVDKHPETAPSHVEGGYYQYYQRTRPYFDGLVARLERVCERARVTRQPKGIRF